MDARGNKQGVNAKFTPPLENLAFSIVDNLEQDIPDIFAEPLTEVVATLTRYKTVEQVRKNLPDLT